MVIILPPKTAVLVLERRNKFLVKFLVLMVDLFVSNLVKKSNKMFIVY